MTTQSSLIIDIGDSGKAGMYVGPAGIVATQLGEVVRYDGVPGNYRFVTKSLDATRSWDDVDLTSATIEIGIGEPDGQPTAGTWALSYGGNSTGLTTLPYNVTAAVLQAAINANPQIVTDSGSSNAVTVQQFGTQFSIIWNVAGAMSTFVSTSTNLAPSSNAAVVLVRAGSAGVTCIQVIKLVQNLYAYTNSFTSSAAGAVTVTEIQAGAPGVKETQRIVFNTVPYGGTYTINLGLAQITDVTVNGNPSHALDTLYFVLQDNAGTVAIFMTDSSAVPPATIANRIITVTIANNDSAATVLGKLSTAIAADPYGFTCTNPSGVILRVTDPNAGVRASINNGTSNFAIVAHQTGTSFTATFNWNATAQDITRAFAGYFAANGSSLNFLLTAVTAGPRSLVTVDVTQLLFPTYNTTVVDLNTFSTFLAFANTEDDTITAVFEIKITFSGQLPRTVYREDVTIYRNVIDVTTLAPVPIPGVIGSNFRITSGGALQVLNTTTGLYHQIYVTGPAGFETFSIVTPGVA